MSTLSDDTSPQAERMLIDLARKMSPKKKLAIASAMTRTLWRLAEVGVRAAHPNADSQEVRKRMAARLLPRHLVIAAYGWDPEKEGY